MTSSMTAKGALGNKALRPKPCKLAMHHKLQEAVVCKLQRHWSPQQITGWLAWVYTYRARGDERVSRNDLSEPLCALCSEERAGAVLTNTSLAAGLRHVPKAEDPHGQIKDAVSIREQLASVEDIAVFIRACDRRSQVIAM